MGPSRKDQAPAPGAPILAVETLRNSSSPALATTEVRESKGIPLVWRIFGGTLLSIGALLALTLYQQLQSAVEKLGDVLVKREDFNTTRTSLWDRINKQRTQEDATHIELKQRCARLEVQARNAEDRLKELGPEVSHLRDQVYAYLKDNVTRQEQQVKGSVEERKQLLRSVRQLRGRLTALEGKHSSPAAARTVEHESDE